SPSAEYDFVVYDGAIRDHEAVQLLRGHAGHEKVVFPFRESISLIEVYTADGDGWHPIVSGLLHAFFGGEFGDWRTIVVHAIGDDRPTVVAALQDEIGLVAAARAVLDFPQFSRFRMSIQSLRVA